MKTHISEWVLMGREEREDNFVVLKISKENFKKQEAGGKY